MPEDALENAKSPAESPQCAAKCTLRPHRAKYKLGFSQR